MDDELTKKVEALETAARKLGLYAEGHALFGTEDGEREVPLLAMRFTVGNIAFAPRTQNPEADDTERRFKEILAETDRDGYDEIKARMQKNMAAGRDPLDDGEDEDADSPGN